jgi:hypothetical protein
MLVLLLVETLFDRRFDEPVGRHSEAYCAVIAKVCGLRFGYPPCELIRRTVAHDPRMR